MKLVEKAKTKYTHAKAVREEAEKTSRGDRQKVKFSRKKLVQEIMFEAAVLGRHLGSTKIVVEKVADEVEKWAEKRAYITEDDITKVASEKLQKYDKDLAYIYKNRGKII